MVLVPLLMRTTEVYDVAASAGAVRILHEHGVDVWVVDFGAPEREDGGLERTRADHVLAVSDALGCVREATGRDVHLSGCSQGGMFCCKTDAYRRGAGAALAYRPNGGRAPTSPSCSSRRRVVACARTGSRTAGGRSRPSGTASAAAPSWQHTVYGVNPVFHPSGLLTTMGGALAGGFRLAMAAGLDPEPVWDGARRYLITAVTYTWTQLRDLVEALPHAGKRGHPVRVFIGSGMPPGLRRRVEERFAPARVLEWTSTEAGAILADVSGAQHGAHGRPLPGGGELRLAAYDLDAGRSVEGEDGPALPAALGEPYRPLPGRLREQGLPAATRARPAWYRSGGSYRRLTKAARDRLLG